MDIEIKVINSSICNKSIYIRIIGSKFEETDYFNIFSNTVPLFEISKANITAIYNKNYTTATLIFDNSNLLKFNLDYILEYTKSDSTVVAWTYFAYKAIVSIDKADIIAHGTKFLTLNYYYPIQISNLDELPIYIFPNSLFIERPNIKSEDSNEFLYNLSKDLKSINIESPINSFNIGSISTLTNYPLNSTNKIYDYSRHPYANPIPTILSASTITTVPKEQTKVISLKLLNKTQVQVDFSNPILLLAQNNPKLVGFNSNLELLSVDRPDYNSPNILIYTLLSPITPGTYKIKIDSILDANGNLTVPYCEFITVDDISPTILSITTVPSTNNKIRLLFSTIMNTSSYSNLLSTINPTNYTIEGNLTESKILISYGIKESIVNNQSEIELTLLENLVCDEEYILTISNVTNLYGTPLSKNEYKFIYTDTIKPEIVDIIALINSKYNLSNPSYLSEEIKFEEWNSAIIVQYNKQMLIGKDISNSADNLNNYLIKDNSKNSYSFLDCSNEITNISSPLASQNLFGIPLNLLTSSNISNINMLDFRLYPGYLLYANGFNNNRYISDSHNNELEITNDGFPISKFAIPINLFEYGSIFFLSDYEIIYTYNYHINANDFLLLSLSNIYFTLDDQYEILVKPINYKLEHHSISFLFPQGSININTSTIRINQLFPGAIKDIFNNAVIFENENSLSSTFVLKKDLVKPIIKSASIVSINKLTNTYLSIIKIGLITNKPILFTSNDDFLIIDIMLNKVFYPEAKIILSSLNLLNSNKISFPAINRTIPLENNQYLIELTVTLDNSNSQNPSLLLSTNLDNIQMSTVDIYGNKLDFLNSIPISNIKTLNFTWSIINNSADCQHLENIFTLTYTDALDLLWFDNLEFDDPINGIYELIMTPIYYCEDKLIDKTVNIFTSNSLITANLKLTSKDLTKDFGVITIYFYATASGNNTIPWSICNSNINFSSDLKSFNIHMTNNVPNDFINNKYLLSSFFTPAEYVLLTKNNFGFINTSYSAKCTSPTIYTDEIINKY